ncbi:hypothetical protein [Nocardiopsis potens]|uniref:hypothetical protein n=1 Tax=Nocardiopsis potens TaxID=1246458 RepID=UPI0003493832|nr:hypothetical protein [Nocardiopsis potens]
MKLHRHRLRLDGREYTAVTPRPGTDVRFATDRMHGMWHLLTDPRGAAFLARLLWGLSYQRRPGTLVFLGSEVLLPEPFGAEPSDPVVLAPVPATPVTTAAARELRRRNPSGPGDGTVRWRTTGLEPYAVRWSELEHHPPEERLYRSPLDFGVRRIGGLIAFSASPEITRTWAVDALSCSGEHRTLCYAYLTGWGWPHYSGPEMGELLVLPDFRRRSRRAALVREELLAGPGPSDFPALLREEVRERTKEDGD